MRALAAVLVCAGCGRLAFDAEVNGDARDGDAAGGERPVLISGTGPGDAGFMDVEFHPSGALAVVGEFQDMIEVGGRVVTTAASSRDMLAAVVEVDGSVRWLQHIGATTVGVGMNVGWLGDEVAAGGYFGGTATRIGSPSAGSGQNALVVRYDSDGAFVSQANWGGSSNVQLRALDSSADRLVLGGLYAGTVDLGTGSLPATGGADNGFLVTMAPDGSGVVTRSFNGSSDVYVNDAALRPDGGVCITGRFNASTDLGGGPVTASGSTAYVACYDVALGFRWARTFGSGATGSNVVVMPDGDAVAVGSFGGAISLDGTTRTSAGSDDVYVIRFDGATGAAEWIATIGGPELDGVLGVVSYPPDEIAIAGRFSGAATIIDEPVQSEGTSDGFVVLLSGDGARRRTQLLGGSGGVLSSLSGMAIDAAASRLALAFTYDGELRVRDLASTAVAEDGALVILPLGSGSTCSTCRSAPQVEQVEPDP